jgi:hypothetical protein
MAAFVNLLIVIGLFALVRLIGAKLGDATFRGYEALCRFLAQPRKTVRGFLARGPRVVIPTIVVWGGALLILSHYL